MSKSKKIIIVLVVIALVLVIYGRAERAGIVNNSNSQITSYDDLGGKTLGVQTGTSYEEMFAENYPDTNIKFFSSVSDMIISLQQHKIDGIVDETVSLGPVGINHPWINVLDGQLANVNYSIAIGNNEKQATLETQMNEFIANSKSSGLYDELWNHWIVNYSPDNRIEKKYNFSGENGTLIIGVESAYEPFSFIGDGELQGFDIQFVNEFCEAYGYIPEYSELSFDAISPGIQSGKLDLGTNLINTEERTGDAVFSDTYIESQLVVLTGDYKEDKNIIESIKDSFDKTFIKEGRWKLFAEGALTTLFITAVAIVCGTIIGFAIFVYARNHGDKIKKFNDFLGWLIQGTPTVVFLMILYYVVFGHSSIDGVWVSIIGFSIIFTCAMYEMLVSGDNAVGIGQTEAARALGYSQNDAFFKMILPQAAMHFLPTYKSEVVSLIKETSVVGYIAVQDLTKISDIVRGRTFEAFFPLISTAIIYFLLAGILTTIVKRVEIKLDPTRRNPDKVFADIKRD